MFLLFVLLFKAANTYPMYPMPMPMPMMAMPMPMQSMMPMMSPWQVYPHSMPQQMQGTQQLSTSNYARSQESGFSGPMIAVDSLSHIVQLPMAPSGLDQQAGVQAPSSQPPASTTPDTLVNSQIQVNPSYPNAYTTGNIVLNRPPIQRLPHNHYGISSKS